MAAATVVAVALGSLFAFRTGPWSHPDEAAHTGYLVALSEGRLPTLDTPIAALPDAENLEWRLALARPADDGSEPRTRVWVANHPPGAYVLVAPATLLTSAADNGRTTLLWQRLLNVAGGGAVVALTAVVAHQLTGRSEAAVVAAGLTAISPYVMGITSLGLTDGLSTAGVLAVVSATIAAVGRGFDRRSTALVVVASAACGLIRLTSLAMAGGVVAVGLVLVLLRNRRIPWASAAAIAAATAVSSGWFYLRNISLYGDPAASAELMARMDRSPRGSWFDIATSWTIWDDMLRKVFTTHRANPQSPFRPATDPPGLVATVVLVLVVLAVGHVVVDAVRSGRRATSATADPTAGGARYGWWLLAGAVLVAFLTTAGHVARGGMWHPRYLLILVPFAACAVASTATTVIPRRGWARLAAFAPVVGLLALQASLARSAFDDFPTELPGSPTVLVGPAAQTAALVVIAAATVAYLLAGGAHLLVTGRDRPSGLRGALAIGEHEEDAGPARDRPGH